MAILRTQHHADFDVDELAHAKGDQSVSVCLPAHNEAATVGEIVATILAELGGPGGLVDEVLVLDDHSSDDTAARARQAGARVVSATDVLADYGTGAGKGQAMWKSLHACNGDLVVWCDADISEFRIDFVVGILGPLLTYPDVQFVKGFYDRPLRDGEGGGRVTELVARPVIALAHPELSAFVQPLAGEYGGRRSALEQVPFVGGYGVDLALLIDLARRYGIEAMAQVDLGVRLHRNRTLAELGPQALAVMQTALARAVPERTPLMVELNRPGQPSVSVELAECPPLADLPGAEQRTA